MESNSVEIGIKTIRKTVSYFVNKNPRLLERFEKQDLEQDVLTHFLERNFFERYDPNITSFEYFVARATKNRLIDISRSVRYTSSLDDTIGDSDTSELEMVEGSLSDAYSSVLIQEMIDNCPDTRISRNYSLTWKRLLELVIDGYSVDELHSILGLSSGRVSQLKAQLLVMVRNNYQMQEAC